jgi:hypothetical protein
MKEELLSETINSLNDICTSILQTKRNISQDILIGKISFVGTTVGVGALVSAIGTAGTGTAIATLSGAAATNATLAWIGGSVLVGTTILTGGAIAVALSSIYFWNGKERKFDLLEQYEKEIINASMQLIKILQDEQKIHIETKASNQDYEILFTNVLYPLLLNIYKYTNEISSNLNPRYKLKFEKARIGFMKEIEQISSDMSNKSLEKTSEYCGHSGFLASIR